MFRSVLSPVSIPVRLSLRCLRIRKVSQLVNIVEVGPRDGLQNELISLPADLRVELIEKLVKAGLKTVETGSFVSPKWVPQMAGTGEVLRRLTRSPGVRYPVLVPNQKGLDILRELLSSANNPRLVDEIAVFVAATDSFNRANLNMTTAECLSRLEPVIRNAKDMRMRVRGYVSVVITCPFSGETNPEKVAQVSKELLDMGCYEVSLGDTVGTGTPSSVSTMLDSVTSLVPVERLAGHFHDTHGTAIANTFCALSHGVRTFDSSIAGLGGCPYSPGATGNLATEDLVYALHGSEYSTGQADLNQLVEIGWWISDHLGRENSSRAAKAIRNRLIREEAEKQKLVMQDHGE